MSGFVRWCKKEMTHLLPAIIYFEIMFNLLHFTQGLMLQPGDVRFTSYTGAIIGGILAGKVILIVDALPFINRFPNQPIIYNITWKFFIYNMVVLLVQILDYFSHQLYHTGSWSTSYANLLIDLSRSLFWGVQIQVMFFFLLFIVFSELWGVIGGDRMKKIFFG
ncbi:MAG: hypothetical protein ACYCQI_15460 [Gammaproteobacteria bacterium]